MVYCSIDVILAFFVLLRAPGDDRFRRRFELAGVAGITLSWSVGGCRGVGAEVGVSGITF